MNSYLWNRMRACFGEQLVCPSANKDRIIEEITVADRKLDRKLELSAKECTDCLGSGFVPLTRVMKQSQTWGETHAMRLTSQKQERTTEERRQIAREFGAKCGVHRSKIEKAKRINECGMKKMQEILEAKGL